MRYSKKVLVLLGPAGSFSDIAASRLRGYWKKKYVSSFAKLFREVKVRNCYGFVPLKNKIVGEIRESSKYFKKKQFRIIRTLRMPVRFVLAVKPEMSLSRIRRIYCPVIVKKQCEKWIGRNLPQANFALRFNSSSAAFKKIVQLKGNSAAAIGSKQAAKLYGLKILARNIQDDPRDFTEFALLKTC